MASRARARGGGQTGARGAGLGQGTRGNILGMGAWRCLRQEGAGRQFGAAAVAARDSNNASRTAEARVVAATTWAAAL